MSISMSRRNNSFFTILLLVGYAFPIFAAETTTFDTSMGKILVEYLKIHKSLSSDSMKGVVDAGKDIAKQVEGLKPPTGGKHAEHYKNIPSKIKAAASETAKAKDIKTARAAFKNLSRPMAMWASMAKPKDISVVYCSMAKGSWLQKGKEVKNPYYGASMLKCGEEIT